MKLKHWIYVMLIVFSVASCKTDDWVDWKTQNEIWMAQNKQQEGVIETNTGLQYKVIYPGNTTDTRPVNGSTVVYDYKLYLIDGSLLQEATNFSSYCITGTETISGLIAGMVEGLKKMHVGADYILYVPWDLAYGEDGSGTEGYTGFIPPYSTLIFEVHLSKVL